MSHRASAVHAGQAMPGILSVLSKGTELFRGKNSVGNMARSHGDSLKILNDRVTECSAFKPYRLLWYSVSRDLARSLGVYGSVVACQQRVKGQLLTSSRICARFDVMTDIISVR